MVTNLDPKSVSRCTPVVSVIIERFCEGKRQILLQTRNKPGTDYHNTLEIPAGKIESYENIYDALYREVKEETNLDVVSIYPDIKTDTIGRGDDGAFAFVPFCCQQQTKGGLPWLGCVFLCTVDSSQEIKEQIGETSNIHWIDTSILAQKLVQEPFFTLQKPVLLYYLNSYVKDQHTTTHNHTQPHTTTHI